MHVLVANLGSTSFKCKLYSMPDEAVIAEGAADRIGQGGSNWELTVYKDGSDVVEEGKQDLPDHSAAIEMLLAAMIRDGAISGLSDIHAVGFKAVHGGPISGAVRVDEQVLTTMEQFVAFAPAHNPPYIAAMKAFEEKLPGVPQVAAFETAFHQTIPAYRQLYAVPYEWTQDFGVRKYGFHGASHRYISERMRQIAPGVERIINLHLGGSCSACAIDAGDSVATTMGATPQTGIFHNNRVGEFDAFAFHRLHEVGLDNDAIFKKLSKESGLLGISGVSADMREVEAAAAEGNERAKLALDAFVDVCRQTIGAYLTVLQGLDALVFTAGIGQHGSEVREAVCANLDFMGIEIDRDKNREANGKVETRLDKGGKVQIWVLPTNEELVVARQVVDVIETN